MILCMVIDRQAGRQVTDACMNKQGDNDVSVSLEARHPCKGRPTQVKAVNQNIEENNACMNRRIKSKASSQYAAVTSLAAPCL
jgi:hypothetical protein